LQKLSANFSPERGKYFWKDNDWSQELLAKASGLRCLFASEISPSPASNFLPLILKKQIIFIYAGSFITALIGIIAIFSSEEAISSTQFFYNAMPVNILMILYAAIIAEVAIRTLATKLENRDLLTKSYNQP
jgi:hypothetical protein